ncbi:MAG: BBP7 family outer membrane beta-barrel protein [Pirellulales bacterium]|nr:BBP7 family outer membrane beta-barrel protein [Pirellulales bacterium]
MAGPTGRYWVRADYLLWWTRGPRVIPLVTTSTNQAEDGIIGQPTTSILFGGERLANDAQSGARLNMGMWFDCGQTFGWEFDLFTLGDHNTHYSFTSTGSPLLARPYLDGQTGQQASELVAKTGVIEGNTSGDIDEYFHSAGVNLRMNLCCCETYCPPQCRDTEICTRAGLYGHYLCGAARSRFAPDRYRVDLIGGYRHYRLDDTLRVTEDLTVIFDPEIPAGTTFDIEDLFRSRNEFHGGELGLIAQLYRGRWSLDLLAKMGFGSNTQVVEISGHTTVDRPLDPPNTYQGGLLTQRTNIGRYSRDEFIIIPQFGAELGYQLTCNLRVHAGYNILFWADVTRAPEQVDYTVNTSQMGGDPLVGPARPAFSSYRETDFWAQGLNFGAEYRF